MLQRTIRNTGKIFIDNQLIDGPAIRKARFFLENTLVSFAKSCTDYYEILHEYPFNYRERQLPSVLYPALAKNAEVVFVEQPISRNNKTNLGRLDYWILCGSVIFLVEIKHDFHALRTEKVRKSAIRKWSEANQQLASISKDDILNLTYNRNAAQIALMVMPYYQGSSRSKSFIVNQDLILKAHQMLITSINPDWSGLWLLPERLHSERIGDRYENYPGVAILANVKSI
jgi:hypothetical protein